MADSAAIVTEAPGIRRLTAANPGPFTFRGTNSYVVGYDAVAVVDPGPDDPAHIAALLAALAGETVGHILLTHAHRDHAGAAPALAAATGAPILRAAPKAPLAAAEAAGALDHGPFSDLAADVTLADGDVVAGPGWSLAVVATPGHASDHVSLAVGDTGILLAGDHVMGWSSTIVAPPDGDMAAYMASLDRLLARPETRYLPGHGDAIADGPARVRALIAHRRAREAAILDRLRQGDSTIPEIVAAAYRDTDPALHPAAALSVLAHLIDLAARGLVEVDGYATLAATYRPA